MKTLYLVRHAKSSWEHEDLDDFERPLNKRGKRDAPYMARLLADKNVKVDLIISSPALRAYSTARIFAKHLGYAKEKLKTNELLYDANASAFFDVIHTVSDNVESLMLFSHNPGITFLSNALTSSFIDNIPTTGISCIELDVESWKEVEAEKGKLLFFEYPKKYYH